MVLRLDSQLYNLCANVKGKGCVTISTDELKALVYVSRNARTMDPMFLHYPYIKDITMHCPCFPVIMLETGKPIKSIFFVIES